MGVPVDLIARPEVAPLRLLVAALVGGPTGIAAILLFGLSPLGGPMESCRLLRPFS